MIILIKMQTNELAMNLLYLSIFFCSQIVLKFIKSGEIEKNCKKVLKHNRNDQILKRKVYVKNRETKSWKFVAII